MMDHDLPQSELCLLFKSHFVLQDLSGCFRSHASLMFSHHGLCVSLYLSFLLSHEVSGRCKAPFLPFLIILYEGKESHFIFTGLCPYEYFLEFTYFATVGRVSVFACVDSTCRREDSIYGVMCSEGVFIQPPPTRVPA